MILSLLWGNIIFCNGEAIGKLSMLQKITMAHTSNAHWAQWEETHYARTGNEESRPTSFFPVAHTYGGFYFHPNLRPLKSVHNHGIAYSLILTVWKFIISWRLSENLVKLVCKEERKIKSQATRVSHKNIT